MKVKSKPVSKTMKNINKKVKNKFKVSDESKERSITPKMKSASVKKKKLKDLTAEEFFSNFDEIDDSSDNASLLNGSNLKATKESESGSEEEEKAVPKAEKKGPKKHKEDLNKLKEVDPEFYQYLQENDQELLNFDDSEDSSNEEDAIHKPPDSLEIASDESDFEPDGPEKVGKDHRVTLKMVAQWHEELKKDKTTKTLREVFDAFQAALQTVTDESERIACRYEVGGGAVFNAVLRLVISEVQPSLRLILKMPAKGKPQPTKSKKWVKVRALLMTYLTNLTKLCQVTSPEMLRVLLKHMHQMLPYAINFSSILNRLLSRFVSLWTSDDDVVRVLSFLCLLRVVTLRKALLPAILKKMYLAFIRNSKFISPNNLSGISFWRQSLAEIFAMEPSVSYQHAFFYIRQLSVHLRNAVTLKKKESYQSVYNWQFIQSLYLWSDLFSMIPDDSPLVALVYPTVQVAIGTLKLIPSAQYYPLRFHCLQLLAKIMEKRGVFIPVVPLALEVLSDFDFNRKHTKVSMKPLDFSCILRCRKLQMQENGFKDSVIESTCTVLLAALSAEAHRISFPDTTVPVVIQIKQFLKTCKVSKFNKQVKAVLDKIVENSKFIEAERKKVAIRLDDVRGIAALETSIKAKGPPLSKYYETWRKLQLQQLARKNANTDEIVECKLPTINKIIRKKEVKEGPVELFPSDDEDSDISPLLGEEVEEEKTKKKTKKVKGKSQVKPVVEKDIDLPEGWGDLGDEDIVENLNVSDLE